MTSPCLDEETILAFCRGDLAADRRTRAHEHIAVCDECRALVSAVARSSLVSFTPSSGSGATSEMPAVMRAHDPAMAATTPAQGLADAIRAPGSGPRDHAPVSSPVRTGDVLAGKYEVERVLGAGGMGIVVAARHTQLEQRVALKFLLPAACEVPGAVARFIREGKAAARITSEHVARVIDTGVLDGGAPYLVLEYLEGSDLNAIAQTRGRLSPAEAIDYVLQACEAIVEAHQLGIVHRDLKPANLFLTRRKDGSSLVKVLDFGISKTDEGSRSHATSASVLMGSPRYMSPEQMISAKDVDVRADVWALGVILFELVTGRPVWEADTVQGLCLLIASVPAPRLRDHAPSAPAILEETIARCLMKRRDERLPSVADLALALEPIAPLSSRTSIDRILRVAGRRTSLDGHPPSLALAMAPERPASGYPQPYTPDHARASLQRRAAERAPEAAVISVASQPPPKGGAGRRVVVGLAAAVAFLLGVGVVLNLTTMGRHASASAPPNVAPSAPILPSAQTSIPPTETPELPSAAPLLSADPPLKTVAATSQRRSRPAPPAAPPAPVKSEVASAPEPPPAPTPTPKASDPNRALSERK